MCVCVCVCVCASLPDSNNICDVLDIEALLREESFLWVRDAQASWTNFKLHQVIGCGVHGGLGDGELLWGRWREAGGGERGEGRGGRGVEKGKKSNNNYIYSV